MKSIRTIALLLIVITIVGSASGQKRSRIIKRRPSKATPSRTKYTPLTVEQISAINDLLESSDQADYKLRYEPQEFADSTLFGSSKVVDNLPDSYIRLLITRMGNAYFDAGVLYGRITDTGLLTAFQKGREIRGESKNPVPEILKHYGLLNATPYQAVAAIHNHAVGIKGEIKDVLKRTPTARSNLKPQELPPRGIAEEPQQPTQTGRDNIGDAVGRLFGSGSSNSTPVASPPAINSLLGNWTIRFNALALALMGENSDAIIEIKQNGSGLTVTDETGQVIANEVSVQGDTFSFRISKTPVAGQMADGVISGRIEGDSLKGEWAMTSQNGGSVTISFTGIRKL